MTCLSPESWAPIIYGLAAVGFALGLLVSTIIDACVRIKLRNDWGDDK